MACGYALEIAAFRRKCWKNIYPYKIICSYNIIDLLKILRKTAEELLSVSGSGSSKKSCLEFIRKTEIGIVFLFFLLGG